MVTPTKLKNEKDFNSDFDQLMNLMLLGETGVGKTSLMRKYVDNEFSDHMLSTIGNEMSHTMTFDISSIYGLS